MSTTEDDDQISIVDIPNSASHNPSSEGQTTNKTIGAINDGDHDKPEKKSNNPYKKFDEKKRDEVILWLQSIIFLLAVGICVASFTVPALRKSRPRGIAMWQWSLLASVLLVGPLLSRCIVKLVLFVNDREFSAKENILYYVAGLIESAWVVLWFSMILIAWLIVVDEPDYLNMPRDKSERIIKKFTTTWPIINVTLITFILGSFLWLLKDLVLMRTKSSFHIRRFFVRIREALKHQSVVDALSPPNNLFNALHGNTNAKRMWITKLHLFRKVHQAISFLHRQKKIVFDASCLDDVNQEEVSCWGMKKVIDWIMENPNLTYLGNPIKSEGEVNKISDDLFSLYAHYDEQGRQPWDYIFWDELEKKAFNKNEKKILSEKERKLSGKVKECLFEGDDTMASKEGDNKTASKEGDNTNGMKIHKEAFKKWMLKAYKHRSSVASALKANKRLFKTLNRLINVLLVLFIFALWLIMIRVETRRVIFVIASAIVGAAVICGDSCKKILDNLLFVFVMHPFDIGDDCLIDNTLVEIKEIHVLSTVALTIDDEIRHYPNSELAVKTISNFTRSLDMADVIEFALKRDTTTLIIDNLKDKIQGYVDKKFQIFKRDLKWVMEFQDCTEMKMRLHFRHKINYDDFSERETRKSLLVFKIKEILNNENI